MGILLLLGNHDNQWSRGWSNICSCLSVLSDRIHKIGIFFNYILGINLANYYYIIELIAISEHEHLGAKEVYVSLYNLVQKEVYYIC